MSFTLLKYDLNFIFPVAALAGYSYPSRVMLIRDSYRYSGQRSRVIVVKGRARVNLLRKRAWEQGLFSGLQCEFLHPPLLPLLVCI